MKEDMQEAMLDLLCKQATYGLSEEEETELTKLRRTAGSDEYEPESFERTIAILSLAGLDENAEMPRNLQSRVAAEAERFFDQIEAAKLDGAGAKPITPVAEAGGFSLGTWLGWAVAAAACIALALNVYTTRFIPNEVVERPTPPAPEEKLTPAQMRERLIRNAPDLARGSFGAGNVKEVTPGGDVVWSDAQQTGYLRLTGLPKNDPQKETYQLWIVAENQNPKTPVDGGTFDINADGEAIIPIDAAVKVQNPQAFAITVEKPGGVVVSTQGKVAALAKRET